MRIAAKCSVFILLATAPSFAVHAPLPPPHPGPPGGSGPCQSSPRGFNSVHEFVLPNPNSFPGGITAGPDGNVWFTEIGGRSRIGRITTNGVITEFPLPPASGPSPDGNLWFAEAYVNKIGVMTAAGVLNAEYPIPTAPADARYITKGPDGNVWFTETVGNKIGRITPSGTITEFPLPGPFNAGPQRIITGPDGNLWFTYETSPGDAVVRITPGGHVTQFTIPHGGNVLPDGRGAQWQFVVHGTRRYRGRGHDIGNIRGPI